jgi:hypothetical protein
MSRRLLAVLLIGSVACGGSSGRDFAWAGEMEPESVVRIRNTNGRITVKEAAGSSVQVSGTRSWRMGFPEHVDFIVDRAGSDVTVCAVWGKRGRCDARSYKIRRSMWDRLLRRAVTVDFVIAVPRGVRVDVLTTNGDVDVQGAGAQVTAATTNGDVSVATSNGPISASSVNGDVIASMDSLTGSEDIDLTTVNGDVTASVPTGLDVELVMNTVNGRIDTDFPLTTSGRIDGRRLSGTLGAGGRKLTLTTVNGDAELRRRR